MSFSFRRSASAVVIAAVAAFPLAGSVAEASTGHAPKASKSQHVKHAKKFHAKFVLVGRVTAVSESGITVTVKGGNLKKGLRGKEVVLAVNETTKITVGDVQKTLADVVVGDRVAVKGKRAQVEGAVTYTAIRIHVKHAKAPKSTPTPTPTAVTS